MKRGLEPGSLFVGSRGLGQSWFSGVGYCSFTPPGEGDCAKGSSGAWAFGAFKDVRTLAGCRHRCRTCARCNYVSHSTLAKECGWFATCDLGNLKLRDNGEAWLTVAAEAELPTR